MDCYEKMECRGKLLCLGCYTVYTNCEHLGACSHINTYYCASCLKEHRKKDKNTLFKNSRIREKNEK